MVTQTAVIALSFVAAGLVRNARITMKQLAMRKDTRVGCMIEPKEQTEKTVVSRMSFCKTLLVMRFFWNAKAARPSIQDKV